MKVVISFVFFLILWLPSTSFGLDENRCHPLFRSYIIYNYRSLVTELIEGVDNHYDVLKPFFPAYDRASFRELIAKEVIQSMSAPDLANRLSPMIVTPMETCVN